MQLTGKEIIERQIVSNYDSENAIQQQGIDLRLDKVWALSGIGMVPKEGKTRLPKRSYQIQTTVDSDGREWYRLNPGYYEVELIEGISVPNDCAILLKSRSSLVRCGAEVTSGQFDAGFSTIKAGCYLKAHREVWIEKYARICQTLVYTSNPVENLYNGQYK